MNCENLGISSRRKHISENLRNLQIRKHLFGILFLHTPSVWGTWEAGVLSTKYRLENVGGYSIHVRGTKHSPHPNRNMSEPSPCISFIQ